MSNYLLIHGAAHGGWCWKNVTSILEDNGHFVVAPDLPGHEPQSHLSPSEISFDLYVQHITSLVNSIDGNVILVGHSLGGAVVEKVIDDIKESKIERAFFVSGFIPKDGDIVGEILKADVESGLRDCFTMNADNLTVELIPERVDAVIYNGCSSADIALAKSNVVPQPVIPLGTAIRIVNTRKVRRIGVVCKDDKSLTPATQERMYRCAQCEIKYLNSGHAPFFSHANELSKLLMET